jgi:hypothetical protein
MEPLGIFTQMVRDDPGSVRAVRRSPIRIRVIQISLHPLQAHSD